MHTYILKCAFEDKKFGSHLTPGTNTLKTNKQSPKPTIFWSSKGLTFQSVEHPQVPNPLKLTAEWSPTVNIRKYLGTTKTSPKHFQERGFLFWRNFWGYSMAVHGKKTIPLGHLLWSAMKYTWTQQNNKIRQHLAPFWACVGHNRMTEKYAGLLVLFIRSQMIPFFSSVVLPLWVQEKLHLPLKRLSLERVSKMWLKD